MGGLGRYRGDSGNEVSPNFGAPVCAGFELTPSSGGGIGLSYKETGANDALAGDRSLTMLLCGRCSDSFCIPKTNGIGCPLFLDFIEVPKSKDAGVFEKRELESPSSLSVTLRSTDSGV